MTEINKRLTDLEKRKPAWPTLTVIYRPEVGYYRMPAGDQVDYRQMLTGAGAQPIDAKELAELERRYSLLIIRFADENPNGRGGQ